MVHAEDREGGDPGIKALHLRPAFGRWSVVPKARKSTDAKVTSKGRGHRVIRNWRSGGKRTTSALINLRKRNLPKHLQVIPVKHVEFRPAKYDVQLREPPLWAILSMHTITSRMVMFCCNKCNERFPTFHPAYRPPDDLNMLLLKQPKTTKNRFGPPVCSIEVAAWDEVPPLDETEAELLVAKVYRGRCLVCDLDIKLEMKKHGYDDEVDVVPMRGWRNRMDPCWRFPHQELADLFAQATLDEAMFVALEHMQVDIVTVRWTGLHKFRKNVISFPQDLRSFVKERGALRHFKVGDRVNSVRGLGDDLDRPPKLARDATADEKARFATDAQGRLVYPATVRRVEGVGVLMLEYDHHFGQGEFCAERFEHVTPRVQMPWHPRQLHGKLVIMLTRNVRHGEPIEGLEVRWDLVCKILRALTRLPRDCQSMLLHDGRALPWREGGGEGEPMHRWYDEMTGMFDVLDEAQCRRLYAPRVVNGEVMSPEEAEELLGGEASAGAVGRDLLTAEDFSAAGMDVRYRADEAGEGEQDVIGREDFRKWLVLKGLVLASELAV